jgi:anti-anti-sigma regulatory factor/uncharacterized membrane protein
MQITEHKVSLGLQALMLFGIALLLINNIISASPPATTAGMAVGFIAGAVMLYANWRRWRYAIPVMLITSICISALIPPSTQLSIEVILGLLIPSIFALIISRPIWVVGSAIATLVLFGVRVGPTGMSMSVAGYILFAMVVGGMTLARVVMNTALTNVQTSAQQAAQALAQAQAQAEQLAQANATQESQLNEQSRLLGLVATLEMPVVQLADGILFAPIVGHIDSRRAQIITERLLAVAYDRRARHMIMDVAGVSLIDTSVASALVQTAQALRLLGCSVTISGVSSSVALTLTQLGVSLEGITTVRSPQEALTQSASIASTPAIEQAWQ